MHVITLNQNPFKQLLELRDQSIAAYNHELKTHVQNRLQADKDRMAEVLAKYPSFDPSLYPL